MPFIPIPTPHASWTPSFAHLHPPPWFCPCVLYSSSCNPLFPLSPPHSPLAIVTWFLISMSLVIFCLLFSFVDYVPVKGEIIWYLYTCFLDDKSQWHDKKLNISYKDILWPGPVGALWLRKWETRKLTVSPLGCAPVLGDPILALNFWIIY